MDEGFLDLRISVRGAVQGVGFRWWTRRLAETLGISGAVWNMPDGSVGIRAQGTRKAMDEFLEALSLGPSRAVVKAVETAVVPGGKHYRGFSITFGQEEE
jgi:acylphosphatase